MANTDSVRVFNGKRYILDGVLLRVTPQTKTGHPSGGYNIWVHRPRK